MNKNARAKYHVSPYSVFGIPLTTTDREVLESVDGTVLSALKPHDITGAFTIRTMETRVDTPPPTRLETVTFDSREGQTKRENNWTKQRAHSPSCLVEMS